MMTGNEVWFDAAVDLYKRKIAQPVLWLGDDVHYAEAKKIFGNSVIKMSDFVHYQENIQNIGYNGEYEDFFFSENYIRAKDRCLKMMDRLDLYGTFGRLDREIVFNKLSMCFLKKIKHSCPDALIMAENAHSHAQYLVYEICLYLNLNIAKFNDWGGVVPLLFLQNTKTGVRQKRKINLETNLKSTIEKNIRKHVEDVSNINGSSEYEPSYMKLYRFNSGIYNSAIAFIRSGWLLFIKEAFFQFRKSLTKQYYQINPYKIGLYGRLKIRSLRRKNLKNEFNKEQEVVNLEKEYVFFALHFEPERTTNPDGDVFHDQMLALIKLRKLLPDNIDIFVKEHQTQFYMADRGARGRSPLFYNTIKGINGVKLAESKINSFNMIEKSIFVATISGTMAREAAIMKKKSLIFGDSWFNGCPNVVSWNESLTFDNIIQLKTVEADQVLKYLLNEFYLYTVPGCQNTSSQKRFLEYANNQFLEEERKGVVHLLEEFFLNIANGMYDNVEHLK